MDTEVWKREKDACLLPPLVLLPDTGDTYGFRCPRQMNLKNSLLAGSGKGYNQKMVMDSVGFFRHFRGKYLEGSGLMCKGKNQGPMDLIMWGVTVVCMGLCWAGDPPPVKADTLDLGFRIETDRRIYPTGAEQEVVLKVVLDAPAAPPESDRAWVNISLVMDRSASMGGSKLARAKRAAAEVMAYLGPRDYFSLVVYGNGAETIVPAYHPMELNAFEHRLERIQAQGRTALYQGVIHGVREVRKFLYPYYIHRVLLLSDGQANVGPSTPSELAGLGRELVKERISVSTVGLGGDYNEDLMTRLSQSSDGNAYFAESEGDLSRIFSTELGDLLNVVATDVLVRITFSQGVLPLGLVGREGEIQGRTIDFTMNQLYGDQQKYALIKARLPRGRDGENRPLARADVVYKNVLNREREAVEDKAEVSFTKDREASGESANLEVIRDYQLTLNALAHEKAIELADQGQTGRAGAHLRKSASRLKEIGAIYRDEILLNEARFTREYADEIEKIGMGNQQRKRMRTKIFQWKNQQPYQPIFIRD